MKEDDQYSYPSGFNHESFYLLKNIRCTVIIKPFPTTLGMILKPHIKCLPILRIV